MLKYNKFANQLDRANLIEFSNKKKSKKCLRYMSVPTKF